MADRPVDGAADVDQQQQQQPGLGLPEVVRQMQAQLLQMGQQLAQLAQRAAFPEQQQIPAPVAVMPRPVAHVHRQQVPKPPAFNPKSSDYDTWWIQFRTFLDFYQIQEDADRRQLLLLALAEDAIKALAALTMGDPHTHTFDQLLTLLKQRYVAKTILPLRRDKYMKLQQKPSQSLEEWQAEVCNSAAECEFGALLEAMMVTRFLGGLRENKLRIALYSRNLTTLTECVEAARVYEAERKVTEPTKKAFEQDVHSMVQQTRTSNNKWKKTNFKPKFEVGGGGNDDRKQIECRHCGKRHRGECRFKNAECHNCGRKGHVKAICRSQKKTDNRYLGEERLDALDTERAAEPSIFLNLTCGQNKVRMQVDSGAALTVLTKEDWIAVGKPNLQKPSYKARSYSGHSVHFKGEAELKVCLNGQRLRLQAFVVEGTEQSILGRDWLAKLKLWKQFKEDLSNLPEMELLHTAHYDNQSDSEYKRKLTAVLEEYEDVFRPGLGHCTQRKIHLQLKDSAKPSWLKAHPVPFARKQKADEELNRLVANNVCSLVKNADWAAPVVLVDKANGELRICGDYSTGLNAALKIDQYPLPRFEDVFEALNGATVFASLDMKDAYLQCELDDESKQLTTISTHRGLFQYNRLPFGIASAPAAFQSIMDALLAGQRRAAAYLDDVVLAGRDETELLQVIKDVLQRFREYGLRLRKEKCQFAQSNIKFLGFCIDAQVRHPNPLKVAAIRDMPAPKNEAQLRAFLGLVNFYSSFVPQLATKTANLTALLKKEQIWQWTQKEQKDFNKLKMALTEDALLVHYNPDLPIIVAADASEYGIGGVLLHQMEDGQECPIAYASKTLTSAQRNYPQIQKEALALHYAVNKFHRYIYGRRFTLQTDHKPLLAIFGDKAGLKMTTAKRLQCYALDLMAYSFDIVYIQTDEFSKADGLSRLPLSSNELDVYDQTDREPITEPLQQLVTEESRLPKALGVSGLTEAMRKDPTLSQVLKFLKESKWPNMGSLQDPEAKQLYKLKDRLSWENDIIAFDERPIIPKALRRNVLQLLHEGHPGVVRMKSRARLYCYWPSLGADVEKHVEQCKPCGLALKDPPKSTIPWTPCERPWQRVHIDHAGPFKDGSYLLILVDAYSKWIEALIVRSTSTETTLRGLSTICARFGWPEQLVADNATGFSSDEFLQFLENKGMERLLIAPRSPWSNGLAERAVGTVKNALTKADNDSGSLADKLNCFLESYRTTPAAEDERSPAERLLGRQPRTPLSVLHPHNDDRLSNKEVRKGTAMIRPTRTFEVGQRVAVRGWHQQARFWQAAIVTRRHSTVQYYVRIGNGREQLRHINQMRPRGWADTSDKFAGTQVRRAEGRSRPVQTTQKQYRQKSTLDEQDEEWVFLPARYNINIENRSSVCKANENSPNEADKDMESTQNSERSGENERNNSISSSSRSSSTKSADASDSTDDERDDVPTPSSPVPSPKLRRSTRNTKHPTRFSPDEKSLSSRAARRLPQKKKTNDNGQDRRLAEEDLHQYGT